MTISRQIFLKNGGIAMLGMASLPSFLQRAIASTAGLRARRKMVVLFQRGAMDGLNVWCPSLSPVLPFTAYNRDSSARRRHC